MLGLTLRMHDAMGRGGNHYCFLQPPHHRLFALGRERQGLCEEHCHPAQNRQKAYGRIAVDLFCSFAPAALG